MREGGIKAPIVILGATHTPEQIHCDRPLETSANTVQPETSFGLLRYPEDMKHGSPIPVHIKLDTGMSRLGTNWQQAVEFVQLVSRFPHLKIASIYSHFATADSLDPTVMQQQHSRFQAALRNFKQCRHQLPKLHLANSRLTLTDPALHYDMVRVGLAIYGLYPAEHLRQVVELKPVLQVKARVTQVKTIEAGTGVSYGYQFVAGEQMRVAVVGIGYADGVPRNLSNKITCFGSGSAGVANRGNYDGSVDAGCECDS